MSQTPPALFRTRHAARGTRHVFVSPHFDDVALSCGGAVAASVAAGADARIVTVFGGAPAPDAPLAPFARQLLGEWGTPTLAEAVRVRRAEDECAARTLGAPLTTLPLVDGAFRHTGYPDWPAMLVAPAPQDAGLPAQIADALRGTGFITPDTTLVGPLGVGRHVDHRLTLAALRQLAGEVAAVWLYEDFPYAIGYPYTAHDDLPDAVRLALNDAELTDATPETVDVSAHIETRIRAIACYTSQIPVLFPETPMPDAVRDYAASVAGGAGAAERFWPMLKMHSYHARLAVIVDPEEAGVSLVPDLREELLQRPHLRNVSIAWDAAARHVVIELDDEDFTPERCGAKLAEEMIEATSAVIVDCKEAHVEVLDVQPTM